jgi:hypothetical protein
MLNQSFMQVFVTNSPALLASGQTVANLAVGQIGILDGTTNYATTTPTYAINKALKFVWGTPDLGYLPLMSGVPNQNEYSKLVKGKAIRNFQGKQAKTAQNQVLNVGWTGSAGDTTNTLFANVGEKRYFWLKFSGAAIDKLYSKQGLIREYIVNTGCVDQCSGSCGQVDPLIMANYLINQINSDSYINQFVKASIVTSNGAGVPTITQNAYQFQVSLCDTQDQIALGIVAAQYPNDVVTRIATNGSLSTYQITRTTDTLPNAVTNAGFVLINPGDCPTCPAGYSLSASGDAYVINRADAGNSAALATLVSNYGLTASGDSASRLIYQYGQSTYAVVSTVPITSPIAGDSVQFIGTTRNTCVLTSPTTFAWALTATEIQYGQVYTLTIGDNVCGTNRLAEIQAAYPDLVISLVNPSGTCVHTYQTTVYTAPVLAGCSNPPLTWAQPNNFYGAFWVPSAPATAGGALVGIQLSVTFVNRITGDCTFDYFPYEPDTIHLQASSFNPDYNTPPESCVTPWPVNEIQPFTQPQGYGAWIRELEKKSKDYALRVRAFDPVVREMEQYQFQTNPYSYYDEYVIEYDFSYKTGGWSEHYTDSYRHHFYFPQGQGGNFQAAINGYLSSAALLIEPVIL